MNKSQLYRVVLTIILLGSIAWLWSTRFDELFYHTFEPAECIDVGDAISFGQLDTARLKNRCVEVTGILGNKAATLSGLRAGTFRFGRYQVRHILGSKLYVEYDQEKYHQKFSPFERIKVVGRLTSFGSDSELQKVRDFFKNYYHHAIDDHAMLIVVDEKPRSDYRYAALFVLSILLFLFSLYASWRAVFGASKNQI